jgi:hypothetical protein
MSSCAYDDSDALYRQHTRDIRDSVRLFLSTFAVFRIVRFLPLTI